MLKKHMPLIKKLSFCLTCAVLITAVLSLDIFTSIANRMADGIYQRHQSTRDEIVIIGLDEKALEVYGQMPWSREIMAQAITVLNQNEDNAPAVIGIDTLYTTLGDEQADRKLVEAVGIKDNVVTATNISFGSELVTTQEGDFYIDNYAVLMVEEPFEALKNVSSAGHVNAMLDSDGILRHAIWSVEIDRDYNYPSFNQVIYKKYMEYLGKDEYLTPPTDALDRWYLPFTSKPMSYDSGFSIYDLVEGNLDPDLFKGKIVLIGPYALGMNDEYLTAIDYATKMYGVEYQANAIAALLNGDLKTEVLDFHGLIILFLVTFFMLYVLYERKMFSCTLLWVIMSTLWFLFCIMMWEFDFVVEIFHPIMSILICFIISVAVNYLKSSLERVHVTNTFKRYVSPHVVTKIIEHNKDAAELGGTLKNITVLFSDIRGFTRLAEILTPHEVAHMLNKYLSMMSECVLQHEGTLDKFTGDGVMAFWGAPLVQEDITFKAVCAAKEMIRRSKELNDEVMEKYNYNIGIGVGINFGSAVVGNFGSINRMDYTAIGDTVNVAARIEANTKAGEVLLSASVVETLDKRVEILEDGKKIFLKGKKEAVEVYSLITDK